jgi:UDP-2,4-diacetamido-2,4,6-trideoxy-beta-L-altropyranose hydrolase
VNQATRQVAFRVDASAQTGTGHVMRCLSLADSLKGVGVRSRFVSRHMPEHLCRLLHAGGHRVDALVEAAEPVGHDLPHAAWLETSQRADAREAARVLSTARCDWIVVDHYALDSRWESALRPAASRLMAIDDLADRVHDCDLLLDQSSPADAAERYHGKVPASCRLVLGARYALLREEFRAARRSARPRDGRVQRVLVFLGGVDAGGHTLTAIEALRRLDARGLHVDVVIGPQHASRKAIEDKCKALGFQCHAGSERMAGLMSSADLAIGAGGSSTWERCCLGLPTLTLCAAENQRPLVEACARNGLIYAPQLDLRDPASFELHLRALLANPMLLQSMSRNGLHAVDGRGTLRVMRDMGYATITVRAAQPSDSGRLHEWRNHPEVRAVSHNSDPIDRAAHEKWFASTLADADRHLLVGEDGAQPVGVVRFDVRGAEVEVSIYLAPDRAGEGNGTELLQAAESWLAANRPQATRLVAQVLGGNLRSHGLFEACGYRKSETQYAKELVRT